MGCTCVRERVKEGLVVVVVVVLVWRGLTSLQETCFTLAHAANSVPQHLVLWCGPRTKARSPGGSQLQRSLLSAGRGAPAASPSIARPEGTVTSFSLTSDRSEVLAGKQKENCRGLNLCAEHSISS